MKYVVSGFLCFTILISLTANLMGMGSDFSKEELKKGWKHCIHGFWVNDETVKFYQGDTNQLNKDLKEFSNHVFPYSSITVILHSGTKRAWSPWDKKPREEFSDWSIHTFLPDAPKAKSGLEVKFDVWIGNKIDLDKLMIPKECKVVSGNEIDNFIHKQNSTTE